MARKPHLYTEGAETVYGFYVGKAHVMVAAVSPIQSPSDVSAKESRAICGKWATALPLSFFTDQSFDLYCDRCEQIAPAPMTALRDAKAAS